MGPRANAQPVGTAEPPHSIESQLKQLAQICREPQPMNLVGIWEETREMDNKLVAQTIDEVYKNYFRHGTDTTKWHLLNKTKYVNPVCLTPNNINRIDQHFIKELKAGRYIVNPDIPVQCRVPFFLKEEGPDKTRFIPDYTWPKTGDSVNSLIPEKEATVELLSKYDLIKFIYNDGTTNALGKNDYKSWYRQIPMSKLDWPISVYHWRGYDFHDTRMPWGTRRASRIAHHFSIAISYIAHKYVPLSLQPCYFDYIDDHIIRATSILYCLLVHMIYICVCTKYTIQLNTQKTELATQALIALGMHTDVKTKVVSVTKKRQMDIKQHLETL